MSVSQKYKAYLFVQDYKQKKYLQDIYKNKYIDMNNYFKYSGKIEKTSDLVNDMVYNYNKLADKLTEIKIKNKEKWQKKIT
tara:strand:+ start:1509 stop:1751 length:243 start_codon:yes stop_codon:yes gene_type:complete